MRRSPWQSLAVLASAERGAFLWVPGLLLAVAVTLFAMRVAPAGVSLFTRTTSLRIAIGPCDSEGTTADESAAFVGSLRRSLAAHGELTLVDSARVARRLVSVRGGSPSAHPDSLVRALRSLNPHLALRLELWRDSEKYRARAEAWDVHEQRPVLAVSSGAGGPTILGRALADSLARALGQPRPSITAAHAAPGESRSSSVAR